MSELHGTDSVKNSRIAELRRKIDEHDSVIIEQIVNRTIISQKIGQLKSEAGLDKIDSSREDNIRNTYMQLGSIGVSIAELILELGRGKIQD